MKMINITSDATTRKATKCLTAAAFAVFVSFGLAAAAQAQIDTLRNPTIPGAMYSSPYTCPPEGCPPPPGSGSAPPPVTQGHYGAPESMPWVRNIPATQIDQSNSYVGLPSNQTLAAPYTLGSQLQVPHPPSTPGDDYGQIPGPANFYAPPAALVNICPQGGMPGDQAPIQRWGGQTTRDLGLPRCHGSQLTDFGERLSQKPDLCAQPQSSQDGPRPQGQGLMGGGSVRASIGGAQTATDLHGNRTLFRGQTRSRLTIAPY
ncbi:MAG: hypothetical protein DKT66_25475 [Candidatus Melainabacteria bacterium]|nr:MAG: hypothetical protein DKT66_25475 [Candidatus Melainabacteria bacterium]